MAGGSSGSTPSIHEGAHVTENTQPDTALDSTATSAKETSSAIAAAATEAEPTREHDAEQASETNPASTASSVDDTTTTEPVCY